MQGEVLWSGRYNAGFRTSFAEGKLTLGVFFPIESYKGSIPQMIDEEQVKLAKLAEQAKFAALWFRDVPLLDLSFGDAGQMFDPWVYLSYITAHTSEIALAAGSVILPLRHPIHTAKAAASVDVLSKGRLIMGVATGDRPVEYDAFNKDLDARGETFRESLKFTRAMLYEAYPSISSPLGRADGTVDLLPKPYHGEKIPILATGFCSRQTLDWIAAESDGWLVYPQPIDKQAALVNQYKAAIVEKWKKDSAEAPRAHARPKPPFRPFVQSLYIDLSEDPDEPPSPIHLGYRLGHKALIAHLQQLNNIGVNHVAFNLKYGTRSAGSVLEELGKHVLPLFRRLKP